MNGPTVATAGQRTHRRPLSLRSLRGRIVAMAAVGAAVLSLVAVVLVLNRDWRLGEATLLDRVMDEADRHDRAAAQQFDDGDTIEIDGPVPGHAVAVFDPDGTLTDRVGPLSADDLEVVADDFDVDTISEFDIVSDDVVFGSGTWAVAVTGCIEPLACRAIVVARLRPTLAEHLRERLAWIVSLVLGAAVLAGISARWVVGRSLRPVDRMRCELEEITAADLGRRIAVPTSGDELEALGTSFNRTIDRLQHGVDAQRRFTSDAAHELRSPLAGLRAVLEVGQRQPDRSADSVATAIAQVDRASRLVDDLLVLARRDGEQTQRDRRPVDLDDLVAGEVREAAARHPDVAFDRRGVAPVQAMVIGPSVARVVRNLVDNAAAHARQAVRVRLVPIGSENCEGGEATDGGGGSRDGGGHPGWVLTVDDDGAGVPPDARERIFERFARIDDSRSRDTGGTGLGLAIVRELVAEHGGTVHVGDSDLGGASFLVRVPPVASH